jgi:hypothetical protein
VWGLLPDPEYHSKHHEHSISCDCPIKVCKCNETNCKCFKSGDAHTSHWAFALPRLSEIFENYYKYKLGGPKSLRSYQFIEMLFWISNPLMTPILVFCLYKNFRDLILIISIQLLLMGEQSMIIHCAFCRWQSRCR